MSKYTILDNGMGECEVKKEKRAYTGARWLTIENTIDSVQFIDYACQSFSPKSPNLTSCIGEVVLW